MNTFPDDLLRLRQRWELAVQSAGFGVWDLDISKGRVHYSPQWTAALGYGDSDSPEATAVWRARVHPDDLQPMLKALTAHLSGQAPTYEIEFRLRAADGAYRWVLSRGRVVERDAGGQPLRAIGTLTDLTNRRQAAARQAEQLRELATRDASAEVLGRMSHELRTPLNAVLGFAQLLSLCIGGRNLEEQRRYVKHIESSGWQLLRMVDDLMDVSHLEQGQAAISRAPVDLGRVVRYAIDASESLARQHGVHLRASAVPDEASVRGDESRLKQVLLALLSNGIKYNRPGGSVAVDVRAPQGAAWTLSVADTGIGIADDQIPRLFEPFHRNGRPHAGVEGLGLGLVLVRALVDMMDGRLDVSSTPGQGSIFTVELPAERYDGDPGDRASAPEG